MVNQIFLIEIIYFIFIWDFDGSGIMGENGAFEWVECRGHNNTFRENVRIFSVKDGFTV